MSSLTIAKWVYDTDDCRYHDASCMLWQKKGKDKKWRWDRKDEGSDVLYRLLICMGRIIENKGGHGCKLIKSEVMFVSFHTFTIEKNYFKLKEQSWYFPIYICFCQLILWKKEKSLIPSRSRWENWWHYIII